MAEQKFLDAAGITHLWSKIMKEDYPNNETLMAVITAIDETKADKANTIQVLETPVEGAFLRFIEGQWQAQLLTNVGEVGA